MDTILKQIQQNVEELKNRARLNQATIKNMKANGLRAALYKDHELELSRIAGAIDTFISCYQMIENQG